MKQAVLQRVIQIKDAKGMSVNKFSAAIGMAQTTVNNYFKGTRAISFELIIAVLNAFPDVSAEWLLRGKGKMIRCEKMIEDNSVNIGGNSQGDINTNVTSDKEVISKLLEQNQQLIMMLAKK